LEGGGLAASLAALEGGAWAEEMEAVAEVVDVVPVVAVAAMTREEARVAAGVLAVHWTWGEERVLPISGALVFLQLLQGGVAFAVVLRGRDIICVHGSGGCIRLPASGSPIASVGLGMDR